MEAVDIDCRERPDLDPPKNENDEVCPWPWGPQQLVGVPLGQYHCEYCGAMCVAGMEHPDYTGFWDEIEQFEREVAEHDYRLHMHKTLWGGMKWVPDEVFGIGGEYVVKRRDG